MDEKKVYIIVVWGAHEGAIVRLQTLSLTTADRTQAYRLGKAHCKKLRNLFSDLYRIWFSIQPL